LSLIFLPRDVSAVYAMARHLSVGPAVCCTSALHRNSYTHHHEINATGWHMH